MLEDLKGELSRRQPELGLERADVLVMVQRYLERRWPQQARARSLNRGVLTIVTASAPLASELRWAQTEIMKLAPEILKLRVDIAKD